ncbi:MAG: ATP-dependent RNA helicase dbp4 [Alyxoria varia]|nr:MAG: ATP-dependent RNA helicase dbp4 [Alyxoria varia]
MAGEITGRKKPTKIKKHIQAQKRKREDVDAQKLQRQVDQLDANEPVTRFQDLPLSEPTKTGLEQCQFSKLTEIQAKAIALGLKGADILGAAKTGSGKTLAFLIPVLENLYRAQCVGSDAGLGGMIISPTRELAVQIFDVLHKLGKYGHVFAAGLVIGGKSLQEERNALTRMNIVVCTPGRILQHLSSTATFSIDNLQMLVLDEADRILDMGFQRDVDAIIEYLPPTRQTMLFSATQSKRVSDLARLSLQNLEFVSVHEKATAATPGSLQQNYTVTPLPQKLDTLWSFLQSAKKSKTLVFLSSGKQVRFVFEAFRRLQPGVPLMHLHGRQKQSARLDITTRFATARHACLFATDVAARGLDFPAVDWVVQLDCPEDADTYIHRVGRTARYEREGRAVLFLDPSEEEGMLTHLEKRRVPVERINVRSKKQQSIKHHLQNFCFKDPELKYLGQKAFVSYVRSVHVQKDKEVFNINKYDFDEFAASLGLPGAPRITFTRGDAEAAKKLKNAPKRTTALSEELGEDQQESDETMAKQTKSKDNKEQSIRTKYDRMFERRNQDVFAPHYSRMVQDENSTNAHDNNQQDSSSRNTEAHTQDLGPEGVSKTNGVAADDLFTVKGRHDPIDLDAAEATNQEDLAADLSDLDSNNGSDASTGLESHTEQSNTPRGGIAVDSNRRRRALRSRKSAARLLGSANQKLVYDEKTGEMRPAQTYKTEDDEDERERKRREHAEREVFMTNERERLRAGDITDREREKNRLRERKEKKKRREAEFDAIKADDATNYDARTARGDSNELMDGDLEVMDNPFADIADLYEEENHTQNTTSQGVGKPVQSVWKELSDAEDENDDLPALAAGNMTSLENQARNLLGSA